MNVPLEKLLETQTSRWQSSDACSIPELLASFSLSLSELSSSDLLDLVCNEARLRESAGQLPTLEEYQQRFPQIQRELATQWQINAFLDTSRPTPVHSQPDVLPTDFGRYEVFREVGRGAMGIVYEAYDRQVRRIVALKCLRSEFGRGSIEFDRFQHEAESIGQLNHPNLVQIYDFGFHNDLPYIVMEYCSGGTLAERLSEPMFAAEAVDLMICIASSVGVAHAAGIIHRDLKPANILLSPSDTAQPQYKVSDFGLAKSLDFSTSATLTGSILGSPAYMSPEQAVGDKISMAPASDVYSLGAILFQCLTSRPPFVGDSIADVLYQVQHSDPLQIRQLNPRTPRPLETIVAKCLSKNPGARYANATELRDDLLRYRSGLAIHARPERLGQKLRRLALRHRLSASLISFSLLMLLGLVVSSLVYSARLRAALFESEELAKRATLQKAEGLLAKANGQRVSNRPGRRLIAQDTLREAIQIGKELQQPVPWFGPYRDEAIETMWLSDLCIRQWKIFSSEIQFADFSPSGRLTCIVYTDGRLEVREWDNDLVLANDKLPEPAYLAFFDEERFLAVANDSVSCYRLSGSLIQREWSVAYPGEFKGGYWLDRKRQRLFVAVTDKLLLIDLQLGKLESAVPSGDFKPTIDIAFHPREELYLIACYGSGVVEIRSLDTHRVLFQMKYPADFNGATGAAWNPDGSEFLLVDGDGRHVEVYEWDGLEQTVRLLRSINPAESMPGVAEGIGGGVRVCWPKNNQLLTHNWSFVWALHDSAITRTEINTTGLSSFTNFSNLPQQFERGSHRLALAGSPVLGSKDAGPLEIALGNEQQRWIRQAIAPIHHLAISHDGRLAVCFAEKRLWFFDLASGNEIGNLDLGIMQLASIGIDGQNNLYITTPDYSAAFQLGFQENRIVFNSARRVSLPSTGLCLSLSTDGKTVVAGAWAGYHSTKYAGVWVKTPDEPTCRKILHGQSGAMSSIDELGNNILVYSGSQVYRATLPELETTLLGPTTLKQSMQFNRAGAYAIAGGKLWGTSDWRPVASTNSRSDGSVVSGFSRDGTQTICTAKEVTTQLRSSVNGDTYLQMEAGVLHYDSQHGTLLCMQADGLYFRDLRKAAEQLSQFGLKWEGPAFKERQPLGLQGVELSLELAGLKDYSQWMDYLDEQALNEASLHPVDGHALFQAAMVYIERCEYDRALALLERCSQLLPNAITPFQWQAYVLAAQQRWPEAIDAATHFIDACNDVEMRLHRAAWYLEVDQPNLAIEDAEQVIAQNLYLPRRARAIKLLAYEQLADVDNARKVQEEISTDRPTDKKYAESFEPMVNAELILRHSRLAACYARQILDPTNPEFATALAWSSLRNGEYESALKWIESTDEDGQTQVNSPALARALAMKVMCHAKLGNLELAQQQFAQLRLLQPVSCTGEWFTQAREIRLLTAEASRMLEQAGAAPHKLREASEQPGK